MAFTGTQPQAIAWLAQQPREKVFEVRERRPRRSLTANAYYWALVGELAQAMRLSNDEVHRSMLESYGACDVFSVRADVPLEGYFRYCTVFGKGSINGKEYKHVRVYKRSSDMDSSEFSRLLEGIRRECEEQGICVLTPAEAAALRHVGS